MRNRSIDRSEMKDKAKQAKQKIAAATAAKKVSDRLAGKAGMQSKAVAISTGKRMDAGAKRS